MTDSQVRCCTGLLLAAIAPSRHNAFRDFEMTYSEACKLPPPPRDLLEEASLFLDFDGTLVEIATRPDAVLVEERLRDLLRALSRRLKGRIAIVSGRAASNIRLLFGDMDLVVGGSHGAELHWPDGRLVTPPAPIFSESLRESLLALQARHPGVFVVEKPFGLALHYRMAPEAEADATELAARLAVDTGLSVQAGKMVVELKCSGADKGTALAAFLAQTPMAGGRPVFIGDDHTDESGFRAARARGGAGVLVGPVRPTAASYNLRNVDETLAFLAQAASP